MPGRPKIPNGNTNLETDMVRKIETETPGSPVRFGIVGAGGIARAYAEALQKTPTATLVAIADINVSAAQSLAEPLGIPAYASAQELIKGQPKLEAVVVCTPPATHPEICCTLLHAGIDVLCEKPLSIDMDGVLQMVEAAEESGSLLTMASKFRCVADVQKAKELLDSGAIGDVVHFENVFTSYVNMAGRWNSKPGISGGGVLIDNGTHSLDLARYFLGPIDELQVIEGKRTQGLAVEETVAIFFHSRSGVMGSIDLSWTIRKEVPYYIQIHGSEGTISLGWRESKWKRHDGSWETFGPGYDKVGAFAAQIENFAKAILGEEPLLITMEDGVASVRAIEAAYESLSRNPWVAIKGLDWRMARSGDTLTKTMR